MTRPGFERSLTGRTLAQIAIAAGILIVGATATTYRLVYRAVEDRVLQRLAQTAGERAGREETTFLLAEDDLALVQGAFLERWAAPDPPGYLDRFAVLFAASPDGAVRNRPEHGDGTRGSLLWMRRGTPLTPETRRLALVLHDLCERYFPAWRNRFVNLFASAPGLVVGWDPSASHWADALPADWDQAGELRAAMATPAANPERRVAWSGAIADPITQTPRVTSALPVDVAGRHLASFHIDVRLDDLVARVLRPEADGARHVLFRPDGELIASSEGPTRLLRHQGRAAPLAEADDPVLAALWSAVSAHPGMPYAGYLPAVDRYVAARPMRSPGWLLATALPGERVRRQAVRAAQWVLWPGLGSLAALLILFATVMRRQIAQPLGALLAATNRVSAGETGVRLRVSRDDEIGRLADAFNHMADQIRQRDEALQAEKTQLERRIAEATAELRASEERYRTLTEHAPEAILVRDMGTGRYIDANENAARLIGRSREELTSVKLRSFLPQRQPDGRLSTEVTLAYAREALAGGAPVFEFMLERDGREIPCEVRIVRLPAVDRQLLRISFTDITERKRAEEELLRALAREQELSELRSQFVSTVSHEFRTPLGIILSSAEILERYFDRLTPEKRRAHLQSIAASTQNLSHLIEEVLVLSKVDAGRMQFTPAPLDVAALCRRVTDEVLSATSHQCPITVHVAGVDGDATGDEALLRLVLTNLLSNAVKYSTPGEPVELHVGRAGGHAVFRVVDRGIGIPDEDQRQLFTAFTRGRNVGSRPGSGLGLAIVKRCVRLHGGDVELTSRVGAGTTAVARVAMFGTAGIQSEAAATA